MKISAFFRLIVAIVFVLYIFYSCSTPRKAAPVALSLNLSFERLNAQGQPDGWKLPVFLPGAHFRAALDSHVRQEGRYAIRLERIDTVSEDPKTDLVSISRALPVPEDGDTVEVSGYIRTENVHGGYAGLLVRIQGANGRVLGFSNMYDRHIEGTREWTRYSVKMPLNTGLADSIYVGALLVKGGRIWVDGLEVKVDGRSLEGLRFKLASTDPNSRLSLARQASLRLPAELTGEQVERLTDLGMLWGFLKYYHPAVGRGLYDWDAALFRVLPKVMGAADARAAHAVEEEWVDGLGRVRMCARCKAPGMEHMVQGPDYGYLFKEGRLPSSLQAKLAFIRDNHMPDPEHYYVSYQAGIGNPILHHEDRYEGSAYPVSALRLLSLYRYWSIVQYLYPNRHLIGKDWNGVLGAYIPVFVGARDTTQYIRSCLALIAEIHDTHANVWGYQPSLEGLKGTRRMPFNAVFAEGKLVVTGQVVDSPDLRSVLPVGAVIRSIDGVAIDSLVRKYQPLTPASNFATQQRDLVSSFGFLLRSNAVSAELEIEEEGGLRRVRVGTVPRFSPPHAVKTERSPLDRGYLLLDKDIGYIRPSRLQEKDLDSIASLFAGTRGIVVDLRCYPSTFMPFTYGAWLKKEQGPFACFATNDLTRPGTFLRGSAVFNGGGAKYYKGRLVIIVDASTQSNAEYTTMALQSRPGAIVIGSMTAGADGNVSSIYLPGNVFTYISGIGVYYPDGMETQRAGVRIDRPMAVTIRAIREGRDEFLDEARRLIMEESGLSNRRPQGTTVTGK